MKEIVIVGIGSRIMMDDGIGIYLVEYLKQFLSSPEIEFIIGETDIDYCLSELSDAKCIVIIDAYLSGNNPGEVTVMPLSDLTKENTLSYSLHGIHILDILPYFRHELKGILIGVEPHEITYGFSLSDTLQSCYPNILKSVYEHVTNYLFYSHTSCHVTPN